MKKLIVQFRQPFITLCTLSVAVFCAMLAGCNVGPKYIPPTVTAPSAFKESPAQFKESDGWTVAQPQDAALRGKWWEIYNQTELNSLEDQLNIDNQNIRQAFENFMEARALVREARSQYFPTVSVGGSYTRSQASSNVSSAASNGTTSSQQTQVFSFPADVSWEPDLWGKVRNTVRASQYSAQLSAADLENERLTEQASLAEYFFEIRGQDALQKILNETVEVDKKALEVVRAAYDTGVGDQISVVEAQTTLESAQSAAINLGIARAHYEHAMAMLIGKQASTFNLPVVPRTSAPPAIPIGVPSQLLERRPDIAAAERRVAEANAQIGVARAAYYPTITLSGAAGYQNTSVQNLFSGPGLVWSVGATLAQTLFDGGLRKAVTEQSRAIYQGTVANYRQTVLTAFQEVEDNLSTLRILSQELQQQNTAVASSQRYLNLANVRYESGMDIYLNVINAQTALLNNQRTALNLQMEQLTASVQLIKALGGGWDVSLGTNTTIP